MYKITYILFLSIAACSKVIQYENVYGSNIFIIDNPIINSGKYSYKNSIIKNWGFNSNYEFNRTKSSTIPFVTGSIGYSKYKNKNYNNKSTFIKVGVGIKNRLSKSFTNYSGISQTLLLTQNKNSKHIKTFKTTLYNTISYKPSIYLKPTFSLSTKYSFFSFDNSNIKIKQGLNIDLNTDFNYKIATIKNIPLQANFYSQFSYLDNTLSKINSYNYLTTLGVSWHYKIGNNLKNRYLKNLKLNSYIQKIKSNKDFKGYNIGVGVSILHF